MRMQSSTIQVVISGAGLVTPLGLSREATWQAVRGGQCGLGPLSALEQALPPGSTGGQAAELPADFEAGKPREVRYLRHAILEALADAKIKPGHSYPSARCGVMLGTTLHGMRAAGQFLRSNDHTFLSDFLAGATLQDAMAGLAFTGMAATGCSACSSSLGSIALAVSLLRAGALDLVIAGGYDTISEYVYAGFNSLRLVAPGALRPFAKDRLGMKLAEGYGIVVLERAEDAAARGVVPMATVLGFGESADAHHLTQPHPQGEGAARAIAAALASAGLSPGQIDLVAAHATGTPDNDAGEYAALSRVFGEDLPRVPVIAFKSHLGHTLGGAGAVELILSALCLRDQIMPGCANVRPEEIEFPGLRVATSPARSATIRATLNTSLGFGGANTCVVLAQVQSEECRVQSAENGDAGEEDAETRRRGDAGEEDAETRRRGDAGKEDVETRRRGDAGEEDAGKEDAETRRRGDAREEDAGTRGQGNEGKEDAETRRRGDAGEEDAETRGSGDAGKEDGGTRGQGNAGEEDSDIAGLGAEEVAGPNAEAVSAPSADFSASPRPRVSASSSSAPASPRPRVSASSSSAPASPRPRVSASSSPVHITGVGVVLPGMIGNEAFARTMMSADARPVTRDSGAIAEGEYIDLLNARRVRRMSDYVKLSLAATMLACRDAGIADIPSFSASCSAVLGSTHGSANYSEAYYQQIVREGIAAANPMLFAEGVPNAGAAHLSLMLSLKGPCQTIIGTRTAGLDALHLAAMRIASGEWERAVVSAAEEYSPLVNAAYAHWGLHARELPSAPFSSQAGGFVAGCGAVTLVLESEKSMQQRGARARGNVLRTTGPIAPAAGRRFAARDMLRALGEVDAVVSSANGTWLDRLEAIAIGRSGNVPVTSLSGHLPEIHSVMPLAAIAAVLLCGGVPRLLGTGEIAEPDDVAAARSLKKFAVLCSDYTGLLSAASIDQAIVDGRE